MSIKRVFPKRWVLLLSTPRYGSILSSEPIDHDSNRWVFIYRHFFSKLNSDRFFFLSGYETVGKSPGVVSSKVIASDWVKKFRVFPEIYLELSILKIILWQIISSQPRISPKGVLWSLLSFSSRKSSRNICWLLFRNLRWKRRRNFNNSSQNFIKDDNLVCANFSSWEFWFSWCEYSSDRFAL